MIEFNLQQNFNDVERKYLEGFYNYFLACISTKEDKTKRYYEAYNIFQGFYTIDALGICVLKVIAFKFNWINSLRNFCDLVSDEFNSICDFYYERYESIDTVINNCNKHLFIEDDIREFIDVINDYMSGNLSAAEKYVEKYQPETVSDINQKDRILVLLNRLAQSKNDIKKAQYYETQILSPDLKNIKTEH